VTNVIFGFETSPKTNSKRKKWGDMAYYAPPSKKVGWTRPSCPPANCAHVIYQLQINLCLSRPPAILHVQIKFKAVTYCHASSLIWVSSSRWSLMNCKLTDFSTLSLKLLLL